ncbi:zinc-finger domain-containing protein [Parvularcula marina]|uniref:zinc-finger domain-containing protein n=1 Tax=Parvularcula marina TaxID=2292771 RepID=UPI0035165EE7
MAAPTIAKPDLAAILQKVTFRPEALEVVFVDQARVACEGPGGASGHPRTFYTVGDEGYAECKYCDRLFVYDPARAGEQVEGEAVLALAAPGA